MTWRRYRVQQPQAAAPTQEKWRLQTGAGGYFVVDTDNNQSTDKTQRRLTISFASSPWECQANVAPTAISAGKEKEDKAAGYSRLIAHKLIGPKARWARK